MSKEAVRVIKQVEVNNLQNIVTKVTVTNLKEFTSCFEKVREACPDTVVMLLAEVGRMLFATVHVPPRAGEQLDEWLTNCVANVINDGIVTEHIFGETYIIEITYPEGSESSPFKLIDVINGTAFSILRKLGFEQDDVSSEENFDF